MNIDKAVLPSLTFLVFAKRILIKHFHLQSTSSSWESEKNKKSTPLSGSKVGGKHGDGVDMSDYSAMCFGFIFSLCFIYLFLFFYYFDS